MVYCSECGKKNEDDAKYCIKCSVLITRTSSFEKNIERFADKFGSKAEQFGKHVEKKVKEFVKSMDEETHFELKHCSDCNVECNYDAEFCWKCGKKID